MAKLACEEACREQWAVSCDGVMEYSISIAQAQDGPALARLRWEFRTTDGEEVPAVSWEQFVAEYLKFFHQGREDGSRCYWIARHGEELIGHLLVQKVLMVPRPCKVQDAWGYLTDNYVRPANRGQGVGRALLEHAIAWAQEQDLELLIVWPSEEAVGHYQRAGFSAEHQLLELRLRDYYDPGWTLGALER